jgi:hypothetical protein
MWLGLAAITLAASIGFNVLALAIQYERLVSRAALQRRREAPRNA